MRILIVTFASRNVTNMGVGRWYNKIADILEKEGHEIIFLNPNNRLCVETNTWSSTAVPMFLGFASNRFGKVFESLKPDAVHIQSEVGMGIAARRYCVKNKIPFSSAYTTNWHIGMKHWAGCPPSLVWTYLRWYYKPTNLIHTCSESAKRLLESKGIKNPIEAFPLGVDLDEFYYEPSDSLAHYPRPFFMSMSRISKEKNLEAFLDLKLPGTKFLIGNGPYKAELQKKYGDKAVFLPYENVRQVLSQGDVFVFPSRFDTFGLTNIEALACGLPVAAFPVMGPIDIIEPGVSGFMSENLEEAALACLKLKKEDCIKKASEYTWAKTAHQFLKNQINIRETVANRGA